MGIIRVKQEEILTYNVDDLASDGVPYYGGGLNFTSEVNSEQTVQDFRQVIRKRIEGNDTLINKAKTILSNSLPYDKQNIETRVNLGDPGNPTRKDLTSYVDGWDGTGAAAPDSWDKITESGTSGNSSFTGKYLDLVKFGIGTIDGSVFLNFRAFLNQISDSYTSDWADTKYVGRGEKFYTYSGFDRKISLSWTVAAQSKIELMPMYRKLNTLASLCAPDYTGNGYMTGNIITLTIGGYIYKQPGIVTGFSYEMNDDNATWEIAIPEVDPGTGELLEDTTVKELPHLIKVTGFNFIPIHTFVPRLNGGRFIVQG